MKKKKKNINPEKTKNQFPAWMVFILPLFFLQSKLFVDVTLLPKYLYACIAIVIASIAMLKKTSTEFSLKHPLVLIFAGFTCWTFLGCSYSSNSVDGLFTASVNLLFLTLTVFLIGWLYSGKEKQEQLGWAMAAANLIALVAGAREFLLFAVSASGSHAATYQITGTFGHKNILSEMILLTVPFHLLFLQKKGALKIVGIGGLFFSAVLLTALLTRSVWLAALVSGLVTGLVYLLYDTSDKQERKMKTRKIILFSAAALTTGALAYGFTESFTTLYKQVKSMTGVSYGSGAERMVLWKNTLKLFNEKPMAGIGTGAWKTEVLKYGYKGLETENNLTFHQRPHNDFLWILAENGIVGFLLYAGIWVYAFVLLWKAYKRSNHVLYLSGISVLVSFAVISCFGFPYERMEHKAVLSFVLAMAVLSEQKEEKKARVFYVTGLSSLLLLYPGILRSKGEYHLHKAYTLRAAGDWEGVIGEVKKSENRLFSIDPMCTPLRWYSGSAWYNLGQTDSAWIDFKKSYELNPNHVHVLNNLASCLEVKGRHTEAILYYKQALKLSPGFTDAKFNLVAAAFNAGNASAALRYFTELKPDTANQNYMAILHAVLKKNLLNLADSAGNNALAEKIMAIHNVDQWHRDVFFKSLENRIPFQRQVLLDAGYLLSKEEKIHTFEITKRLLKQYPRKNTDEKNLPFRHTSSATSL